MRLVQFPYVVVRVGCNLCHREGVYRLARLAVRCGPNADLEDVLAELSKSCPYRREPHERSRSQYVPTCHAHFVDLRERTPPDLPPGMGGLRVIDGGLPDDDPTPTPAEIRRRERG
ncbi:hypothetical protein [Chenggangzhangella methanolivorans]|uniref:Uncharacterized protein n=1 Tax=Chenggangzhangella methanolivorans TaxID=1437009 RepID=A0A9E6R9K3_9HYPH|nr:hypothetical protein [Chenggangzhangella methanolivorans]QZN99819.1 hypothetical protein K6K41_24670 [Chenggangzhangella methanolivorans]